MRKTWNKIAGVVAITFVFALLVSSSFFRKSEGKFRTLYYKERLKNDSLLGTVQTLKKQFKEQEQELKAKNSLIDSLTQVCTNQAHCIRINK